MGKRSLGRKILFYLSAPKCINCKERLSVSDFAFCKNCNGEFSEKLTRSCSHCFKNLSECDCAPAFLSNHFVKKLYKCFRYTGNESRDTAVSLIYSLKRSFRFDVTEFALDLLEKSLKNSGEDFSDWIFTNVPRRKQAILEYGIDQSENLAKKLAKRMGAKYEKILSSESRSEQKQLTREERMANANFKFITKKDLSGSKVMILDDVVTTGASMGTASSLLRSLGVKEIRGICLAIAYPD